MLLDVLSMWQPHATALVHPNHPKTIETRTQPLPASKLGRWLAVYATLSNAYATRIVDRTWSYLPAVYDRYHRWWDPAMLIQDWADREPRIHGLPRGAIVGLVRFTESLPIIQGDDTADNLPSHPAVISTPAGRLISFDPHARAWSWSVLAGQRPWGLWTPGRYAWVSDARVMFDTPILAKAPHQGWWKTDIPDHLVPGTCGLTPTNDLVEP
jgi:hypothetical protein